MHPFLVWLWLLAGLGRKVDTNCPTSNNRIGHLVWVYPNTHTDTLVVRNGFLWVVRIATVEYKQLIANSLCRQLITIELILVFHPLVIRSCLSVVIVPIMDNPLESMLIPIF